MELLQLAPLGGHIIVAGLLIYMITKSNPLEAARNREWVDNLEQKHNARMEIQEERYNALMVSMNERFDATIKDTNERFETMLKQESALHKTVQDATLQRLDALIESIRGLTRQQERLVDMYIADMTSTRAEAIEARRRIESSRGG